MAFGGIQAQPRPVQKPHPPVVVGGMSPSGLRRAARYGNGWYGFALDLDATRRAIEGLRAAEQRFDRDPSWASSRSPSRRRGRIDRDTAHGYAALGVDRLVLLGRGRNADEQVAAIELAERELVRPLAG